jgi:hypothetical protein
MGGGTEGEKEGGKRGAKEEVVRWKEKGKET